MWRERFKTASIVVVLTGLIWFFADQADVASKTVRVRLDVRPAEKGQVIIRTEPEPLDFDVTFRASRGAIRQIEEELRVRPWQPTFVVDKQSDSLYADLKFESMRELPQLDVLRQRPLTVTSVWPETFRVEVDTLVRRTVQIQPQFGEMLVEEVEPRPAAVDVILPSKLAETLSGDTFAVNVGRYVDTSRPGEAQKATIELQWPGNGPQTRYVRFEPETVDIRFRLKDTTASARFQSVQVSFSAPPDLLDKYTPVLIEPTEFRPDIQVSGPKQLIDNLNKTDIKLVVELYSDDRAYVGTVITRKVLVLSLPPGVRVTSPPRDVRFRLEENAK